MYSEMYSEFLTKARKQKPFLASAFIFYNFLRRNETYQTLLGTNFDTNAGSE